MKLIDVNMLYCSHTPYMYLSIISSLTFPSVLSTKCTVGATFSLIILRRVHSQYWMNYIKPKSF